MNEIFQPRGQNLIADGAGGGYSRLCGHHGKQELKDCKYLIAINEQKFAEYCACYYVSWYVSMI